MMIVFFLILIFESLFSGEELQEVIRYPWIGDHTIPDEIKKSFLDKIDYGNDIEIVHTLLSFRQVCIVANQLMIKTQSKRIVRYFLYNQHAQLRFCLWNLCGHHVPPYPVSKYILFIAKILYVFGGISILPFVTNYRSVERLGEILTTYCQNGYFVVDFPCFFITMQAHCFPLCLLAYYMFFGIEYVAKNLRAFNPFIWYFQYKKILMQYIKLKRIKKEVLVSFDPSSSLLHSTLDAMAPYFLFHNKSHFVHSMRSGFHDDVVSIVLENFFGLLCCERLYHFCNENMQIFCNVILVQHVQNRLWSDTRPYLIIDFQSDKARRLRAENTHYVESFVQSVKSWCQQYIHSNQMVKNTVWAICNFPQQDKLISLYMHSLFFVLLSRMRNTHEMSATISDRDFIIQCNVSQLDNEQFKEKLYDANFSDHGETQSQKERKIFRNIIKEQQENHVIFD